MRSLIACLGSWLSLSVLFVIEGFPKRVWNPHCQLKIELPDATGYIEQFTPPYEFPRAGQNVEIASLESLVWVTIFTRLQFLHFNIGEARQFQRCNNFYVHYGTKVM